MTASADGQPPGSHDPPRGYRFLRFPSQAIRVDRERLDCLPASASRVFWLIQELAPISQRGLRETTGMPERTIRFAVRRLRQAGLVDVRRSLQDCRTRYFFVSRACIAQEALEQAKRDAQRSADPGAIEAA
jgi:DNA-binding MarR family transcriptional regulator